MPLIEIIQPPGGRSLLSASWHRISYKGYGPVPIVQDYQPPARIRTLW